MHWNAFLCCQQQLVQVYLLKRPFHCPFCHRKKRLPVYSKLGKYTSLKSSLSLESSGAPFSAADVFTFLALRAQESICKDTAQVDGLGKFYSCGDAKDDSSLSDYSSIQGGSDSDWSKDEIPSLFNWCPPSKSIWSDRKSSRMLGGRKFSRAFVDVWRASQKERHPLIGRRFYQGRRNAHVVWVQTLNVTSATPLTENLDIAGVSLFLEPRNVHTPIFRADLRYFELNHGGLWWFVGSVDLIISASSSTSIFAKEAKLVYSHWKQLCEKHRSIIPFVRDPSQEPIPFGNLLGDFDTVERGRSRAFAFTNDVMDSLLSVYLPLTRKQSPSFKQLKRNKSRNPHLGFFHLDPSAESSYTWDTYSLSGGTVLESSFCEEAPLAMWRFNLFPPPGTAAAKVIAELRSEIAHSLVVQPEKFVAQFPAKFLGSSFLFFLLPGASLPANTVASLYWSVPPYENWSFVGLIGNDCPSKLCTLKLPAQSASENVMIELGISIENMSEAALAVPNSPTIVLDQSDLQLLVRGIATDFFRFVESFGQSMGPGGLALVDKWFQKFQEKLQSDPWYWRRISDRT